MNGERLDNSALLAEALSAVRALRLKVAELEQGAREPIAIVGMSCRLPGGVNTVDAFWAALEVGQELLQEVPKNRWDNDVYYHASAGAPGKICSNRGGFVVSKDLFDASFFRISPREAAYIDPQQRVLLEAAWEALENANIPADSLYATDAGVFMGISSFDYAGMVFGEVPAAMLDHVAGTGSTHSAAAGRISYALGLHGPSISIDTACSSSLVAVQLACESLRRGECSLALAGGVNMLLSPLTSVVFSRAQMLSPDGRCKTFDDAADGYVRSEGAGIVVLKRLSSALSAGNRILAVIRGAAVNQDGPSGGLTVPNGPAQQRVVLRALQNAGVAAEDVGYIEAHGTGTPLGDPIELNALGEIFGATHDNETKPLFVGSAKTNVGHMEAAAGVGGLIKLVLQLQRGTIAPHLNLRTPSRRIAWKDLPVRLPVQLSPWPIYGKRRVGGVSSFGFTGTNAHVIVEEAPAPSGSLRGSRSHQLLCLSAKTESALSSMQQAYATLLKLPAAPPVEDVCHSATAGRSHFEHRLAVVASSAEEMSARLAGSIDSPRGLGVLRSRRGDPPGVAFLFTGQGVHYEGAGRELYRSNRVFRQELERCAATVSTEAGFSVIDALYGGALTNEVLRRTEYAQPITVSLELALAALLRSWGVHPQAVMGHSLGEYTAACVAGIFSVEEALKIVSARGRLMQALPETGCMVVLECERARVESVLESFTGDVAIAAVNGPAQTVISGRHEAVDAILSRLSGVRSRSLDTSHAFHSPVMQPMLSGFAEVVARVTYAPPNVAFVSNLTGAIASLEPTKPEYWVHHVRAPVQFLHGIEALHASGCDTFLEIGPKPTLLALGRQCLPRSHATWLPSLDPRLPDWEVLLNSLAALYTQGVPLDWAGIQSDYGNANVTLPSYPFERQKYWYAAGRRHELASTVNRTHPLLGRETVDATHPDALVFESELSASSPAYLADHQVLGCAVFPATGYLELACAAARIVGTLDGTLVRELRVVAPLRLEEGAKRRLKTVLTPTEAGDYAFRVLSRDTSSEGDEDAPEHDWQIHAQARLARETFARHESRIRDDGARASLLATLSERTTPTEAYEQAARKGMRYGAAFRGLREIRTGSGEAFAELELAAGIEDSISQYVIHPTLLDSAFQTIGPLLPQDDTYLPEAIDSLQWFKPLGRTASVYLKVASSEGRVDELSAELEIFDDARELALHVCGLKLKRVPKSTLARARDLEVTRLLYRVEWKVVEGRESAPGGAGAPNREDRKQTRPWLLIGRGQSTGHELERALRDVGQPAVVVAFQSCSQVTGIGPGRYVIDPTQPAHYGALLDQLVEEGELVLEEAGIVYLGGLDIAPLDERTAPDLSHTHLLGCGPLLNLVQALGARTHRFRLAVVTRGATRVANGVEAMNVEQSALLGLLATVRSENPAAALRHLDLDPALNRRTDAGEVARLVAELLPDDSEELVAFRANQRLVGRLARVRAPWRDGPIDVRIQEYGSADQLVLCGAERRAPGPGELEIAVRAAGLNFKDVLHVWGLLRDYCEERGLPWIDRRRIGFECAGVVVRVGEGGSRFEPGDEVIGIGFECLSSFVTLDAMKVVRKPRTISHAQAAGLPTAYLTAVFALVSLARLKPGQTVLVHAAAGGVGQAAIQVCKQLGAEVFATASPPKWDFLRAQGVRHVMSSRTLEFEPRIAELTEGRGVDVVLNSLPGEFIPAGLRSVAQAGTFVEIGKRGIWSRESVADVRPDLQYFNFDLGEIDASASRELMPLLERVCEQVEDGELAALPVRSFPVAEVAEALRTLAEAKSVGKVVVEFPELGVLTGAPEDSSGNWAEPRLRERVVRDDGSYLITGGLGALGLEVATWLVRQGARHLALMSRRPPDPGAQARIGEMEAAGVRIQVFLADITGPRSEVETILNEIGRSQVPLRGVVHAAGVIDDGLIQDLTWQRFERVLAPKVVGAWNLHCLTKELPLDFFVAFSSVAACLSSPGQANYAAANSFLDALMQARRGAGLTGSSIGWGPWASTGMAARLPQQLRDAIKRHGMAFVPAFRNLAAMQFLLEQGEGHALVTQVNWQTYLERLGGSLNQGFLSNLTQECAAGWAATSSGASTLDGELASKLSAAPDHERRSILMDYIRALVTKVLKFPAGEVIEPRRGLFDLGMDSLSAVEIKNGVERALQRAIPTTVMLDFPTLEGLTDHLHDDVLGYSSNGSPRPIAINA